ncbi:MAG: efflux RND transporter periplasmic adaptor subunit [Bacteroidetes bacterium]|nr:efflux RND transporter periplasmic adaptor subunit [Bacteroidota bacterium]
MLKLLSINLGLMIVLILSQTACTSYGQPERPSADTLQLPVLTLKERDTLLQTPYVADIQAVKNVEIRTRVKGFLETIFVDEGKPVKKGQPLFKINDEEYKVALSKAKAGLSNAIAAAKSSEVEVQRVQILVNKQVVAASELEVAQAKLAADNANIEEARAAVKSAENHVSYTLLRAPFDGIIDRIPLKAGSLIDEGALLTTLSDISSMYAYFSIPENEYLQYERSRTALNNRTASDNHSPHDNRSNEVKLILADGKPYAYPGKIETVEGEIEQNTGSIDYRARFPNPQQLLRHGATGKLYLSNKIERVLLVPQQAVFDIQDKSYVYIVNKDNTLKMRSFTPLTRITGCYVVREGLHADENILCEGAQNVREGMTIQPRPVTADMLQAAKK